MASAVKKFLEIFRGARKIEIFLAMAAIAILLLQYSGSVFKSMAGQTELEQRLSGILGRVEGVGAVSVMVTEDADGGVEGVLVVAEGAENIGVQLKLRYAVQTLLDVETSRIEVVKHAK